jgi:hypothetical protein
MSLTPHDATAADQEESTPTSRESSSMGSRSGLRVMWYGDRVLGTGTSNNPIAGLKQSITNYCKSWSFCGYQ